MNEQDCMLIIQVIRRNLLLQVQLLLKEKNAGLLQLIHIMIG